MVRVLVVDDDEAIRFALRMVLEEAQHTVEEAANGIQALAQLRSAPPDERLVVLLDYMMPQLDGAAVLSAVARDHKLATRHAYFVLTAAPRTAPFALDHLARALDVRVIIKPFDIDELLAAVEAAAQRLEVSGQADDRSTQD